MMKTNCIGLLLASLLFMSVESEAVGISGSQTESGRLNTPALEPGSNSVHSTDSLGISSGGFWFSPLLGASDVGIVAGINLSLQQKHKLFSFRYMYNEEFSILGPLPLETLWDAGPMIGWTGKNRYGSFSVSSGLALTGGIKRGDFLFSSGWFNSYYEQINFITLGLPIDCRLNWTPSRYFGIGLAAFGNINVKRSYSGVGLTLLIGKLK